MRTQAARVILLLSLLLGCATASKPPSEEILPHVKTFEDLTSRVLNVDILFVDELSNKKWLGVCRRSNGAPVNILIVEPYWHRMSYYQREQLVLHEAGHCVLGLPHNDNIIYDDYLGMEVSESIMNSIIVDEDIYLARRAAYWKEYLDSIYP